MPEHKTAGMLATAATAFLWSLAGLYYKGNPFAIGGACSLIASFVYSSI